jgi:hypothetical protein
MPDPILTWAAHNWGWLVALVIFLVVNGDKVVVRLSQVAPPLARWLEAREAARQKQQNGQAAAVLQHVIASDTRGEMTQVSMIERVLAMLDSTMDRLFQDRDATRADLKDFHNAITELTDEFRKGNSELRSVVARHNDILGGHGQGIARLADEVEDHTKQLAGVNGKLDSLGAWMEIMQDLRREVSG